MAVAGFYIELAEFGAKKKARNGAKMREKVGSRDEKLDIQVGITRRKGPPYY